MSMSLPWSMSSRIESWEAPSERPTSNLQTLFGSPSNLHQRGLDLLLEAGKRVHITHKERPSTKTPPQFPTMLRSHLSGGRIVDIKQHDFDRVMEFAVERGGEVNTSSSSCFQRAAWCSGPFQENTVNASEDGLPGVDAGEEYLYHPARRNPRTVSLKELAKCLPDRIGSHARKPIVHGLRT